MEEELFHGVLQVVSQLFRVLFSARVQWIDSSGEESRTTNCHDTSEDRKQRNHQPPQRKHNSVEQSGESKFGERKIDSCRYITKDENEGDKDAG